MDLRSLFAHLLARRDAAARRPDGSSGPVYECRHCGTTVRRKHCRCPTCDRDEIASYAV